MRYRGGGIGHGYMWEIEDWFEDMKHEQVNPEGMPQATQLSWDADDGAEEPMTGIAEPAASAGSASRAGDNGDDHSEEEDSEDEWLDTDPGEDNYFGGEDSEEDGGDADDDNVSQGTYGMGKY